MTKNIYIAGASSRARTAREYIEFLTPDTIVRAFLVSPEMTDNEDTVDGVPVVKIQIGADIDTACKVYLGTRGVNHEKLAGELRGIGFADELIIPVTVELDMKLRNEYLIRHFEKIGRHFEKIDAYNMGVAAGRSSVCNIDSGSKLSIFVVSSAFDKSLTENHEPRSFEQVIQVGCALTDKRIDGAVYDDSGDNISDKNMQFCELTALYWIWKNVADDFVGIEHYRRFFLIEEDIYNVMSTNNIDVILPTPLCVMPSLGENYKLRHEPKPFEDMMVLLKSVHPDEYDAAVTFFGQRLYSPCNMLIAKKEVYDHLCEWMFPILFGVTDMNGSFSDRYQNRYPGFLSERLISFFFELHRDKYKVVYADKNFLN